MKSSILSVKTIKILAMAAISQAKSGHGGIVLGAAPIMYALFHDHLTVDVTDLNYFNRDRFILSSGHGSALLYATMLVADYHSITIKDLKQFRQLNSKTSGHPENKILPGVEVCTGPLGQGAGMSVGFAIAEQVLNHRYQIAKNQGVIDHYTYVLLGDGDLQEGVTQEAMAIAGKQKLNKLIWLYDSNQIQLDGKATDSTIWNLKKLCQAYHWNHLLTCNDPQKISRAIKKAKKSNKPTLIEVRTIIGDGSVNANTNKSHGLVLNEEELNSFKKTIDYNHENFAIPEEVKQDFACVKKRGLQAKTEYQDRLAKLNKDNKKNHTELLSIINRKFAFDPKWFKQLSQKDNDATRNIVGQIIQTLFTHLPTALAVSPDLSSSTKIFSNKWVFDHTNRAGRNINVGVREFIAGDIINGIVAHGGTWATTATFLSFSDYNKAAIRLAAISHLPVLNIYSHDSITVGEDGPTHQPIEQIPSLRLIPNHYLFRPANFDEALYAIEFWFKNHDQPTTIITSRGNFAQITGKKDLIKHGGYVLEDNKTYDLTIIATGSEVGLAHEIIALLKKDHLHGRLVSVPCVEIFNQQTENYIQQTLGNKPVFSLEFASTTPWYQFADYTIGIDQFGLSGKPNDLLHKFGLTAENIAKQIQAILKK